MWRKLTALVLTLALPTSVSAGPLKDAVDKAARELAREQQTVDSRGRGRFWTGIALTLRRFFAWRGRRRDRTTEADRSQSATAA